MPSRLIAGAMSGTSADGVDVAIVRIEGRGLGMTAKPLYHHHRPYDPDLRQTLFFIRDQSSVPLAQLASLARDISLCYANAVNAAADGFGTLEAIAAHGQTLFHEPPSTIQWLDPALLAAQTNTPVICDFRRADCAAGGQGAPLVPFADYILFRHATKTRVLLNIGGIANLTYLPAGGTIDDLIAFDTGPGNCICDMLVRPDADYDAGGIRAASGTLIPLLLDKALGHDWFAKVPPKSTDGPAMVSLFQQARKPDHLVDDLLRTACELSARSISTAIRDFCPSLPQQLIASGGGIHNKTFMNLLKKQLNGVEVLTTDDFGIPSSAKEAIAFALLGAATLDDEPANVPSCTGAKNAVILGSITPRPVK